MEDPQLQEKLCDLVIRDGLSVRELESLSRKITLEPKSGQGGGAKEQDLPDVYYRVLEHVGKYFSSSISMKRNSSGKGTMTIRFNSDDEVKAFVKALEEKQF